MGYLKENQMSKSLIVVLNDGETFTNLEGCFIEAIPEPYDPSSSGEIESFLKDTKIEHDSFPLAPISSGAEAMDTIMKWMTIFFPHMHVREDESGCYVIETNISKYENLPVQYWDGCTCDRLTYHEEERTIIKPAMEKDGFENIKFLMGEKDSFGPLTRVVQCNDKSGKLRFFVYG